MSEKKPGENVSECFCSSCKKKQAHATKRIQEMSAEIAELRKDKERLDWLIHNQFIVARFFGTYRVLNKGIGPVTDRFDTPREAIDAAMKEGE